MEKNPSWFFLRYQNHYIYIYSKNNKKKCLRSSASLIAHVRYNGTIRTNGNYKQKSRDSPKISDR